MGWLESGEHQLTDPTAALRTETNQQMRNIDKYKTKQKQLLTMQRITNIYNKKTRTTNMNHGHKNANEHDIILLKKKKHKTTTRKKKQKEHKLKGKMKARHYYCL